jgi:hypothetical protein
VPWPLTHGGRRRAVLVSALSLCLFLAGAALGRSMYSNTVEYHEFSQPKSTVPVFGQLIHFASANRRVACDAWDSSHGPLVDCQQTNSAGYYAGVAWNGAYKGKLAGVSVRPQGITLNVGHRRYFDFDRWEFGCIDNGRSVFCRQVALRYSFSLPEAGGQPSIFNGVKPERPESGADYERTVLIGPTRASRVARATVFVAGAFRIELTAVHRSRDAPRLAVFMHPTAWPGVAKLIDTRQGYACQIHAHRLTCRSGVVPVTPGRYVFIVRALSPARARVTVRSRWTAGVF